MGAKHYKYWKVNGKNCTGTKADKNMDFTLNCCEFIDGSCIVGASNGNLYSCKGSAMGQGKKIHNAAVDGLYVDTN